jgi:hypothetical protein
MWLARGTASVALAEGVLSRVVELDGRAASNVPPPALVQPQLGSTRPSVSLVARCAGRGIAR